jgi:S-formylglutathione hydrolase FrmB
MILRGYYGSDVLHTTINVQFITPDKHKGPYKVVYLLHGLHGNQGTWIDRTMLPCYCNDYDAVFVMPDVGRSFYCNQKYGRKFFSFVSEELPEISRNIFNISAKREDTAVMGCSMGGYGALKLALTKPEQFSFCGSIAAACVYLRPMLDGLRLSDGADSFRKKGAEEEEILNDIYSVYGAELEYLPENDISELLKIFPADKPMPKIYSTCGTEDNLRKENLDLRDDMKKRAFDFTYEEWKGGHDWYFFSDALKKTLDVWYKR